MTIPNTRSLDPGSYASTAAGCISVHWTYWTVSHQISTPRSSPTSLRGAFECTKPFIRDRLREGKDVAIFVGGAQVLPGVVNGDDWGVGFKEEKGGGEGCLQGGPAPTNVINGVTTPVNGRKSIRGPP